MERLLSVADPRVPMKAQIIVNVVVVLLVQALYTYRVWILSGYHRGLVGYFVVALLLAGYVVGPILAYEISTIHYYADITRIAWSVNTSLATSTATDFVLAGAMCWYLLKSRSSHSDHLNTRISHLIQYTLGSGIFTSACSLSAMICYIVMPDTFIYLAVSFALTKLYVGSFLAMLNARQHSDNGSSRYDPESSKGTALRVQFHTTSYTRGTTPTQSPPSAYSGWNKISRIRVPSSTILFVEHIVTLLKYLSHFRALRMKPLEYFLTM
ncbi:hypothetical protein H0H92_015157 [Tricholoma furcatifolium]|nr:hypothetical protein H0H92_015157 [Tricholoma furcatifolium]